ncbi:AMP-binding protein [Pseudonocardia sp. RS11V-5]|uniref:AMP-binding protein n=1 Tax=Pseudonocardia terrae TaxID=2905831 RepID=UPI001E4AF810|nr:AMP-binding protein [Pseudonocardia terrae]MCE3550886.1 AMP-binding protein [Pseudonocardia terrae]
MSEHELTARLRAEDELITDRLRHWARTTGDRTFLYYGEDDVSFTYAEFDRRTDAIAGNLAGRGVTKGDRVSVFSLNPMITALVMVGCWKAGAVYAPVNFSYTGRLLSYQLDDTRPVLIVTDPALLPALNAVADVLEQPPAVALYTPPESAHDHAPAPDLHPAFRSVAWGDLVADAAAPQVTVAFDDPANVFYTSGTTGPSKGVLQPFRWMAQYTWGLRMTLSEEDVVYNDLPMYHVGGALANFGRALWQGSEVAVWNRFSPTRFWERVASRGATSAILLDVMIPWLSKAPACADDRRNTLNKAYMQPLPLQHNEFSRRFGIDHVAAGFGQTEAGAPLCVLIEETAPGEGTPADLYRGHSHEEMAAVAERKGVPVLHAAQASRKGLMGRPSPFFDVTVRNERDEECEPEEPGHLSVRPKVPGMLLQSYLNKPEATVTATRNLWFHTGDAALVGEDGLFYFVDRLGDRIRVRGENLSSFQVEDMLNQHPVVRMSAAFPIPGAEGDEDDIVAYVVPTEGAALTTDEVYAFAEETMPKYMRPRHVRIVDDIPRTPTNKVEKYRLRQRILAELQEA